MEEKQQRDRLIIAKISLVNRMGNLDIIEDRLFKLSSYSYIDLDEAFRGIPEPDKLLTRIFRQLEYTEYLLNLLQTVMTSSSYTAEKEEAMVYPFTQEDLSILQENLAEKRECINIWAENLNLTEQKIKLQMQKTGKLEEPQEIKVENIRNRKLEKPKNRKLEKPQKVEPEKLKINQIKKKKYQKRKMTLSSGKMY
ncbi:hypothetical protein CDAR_419381 [Caerostris darwini]|uniref:Uncharacterized protein n=1 Tax=Caerostris darwini TaxID=1538125 RepID=A0AAV4T357_9ARAC|nr:hypothetical protein CDAR_419381 [Caerostris darwini]